MKRSGTRWLRGIMDDYLPPALRDARWFMSGPARLILGSQARTILDFKDRAPTMTHEEFTATYRAVREVEHDRATDLNEGSLRSILRSLVPGSVLEIGCGGGHLASLMSATHEVTACDIVVSPELPARHPNVRFLEARFEDLPAAAASFDNVVSTHTLEHVIDLQAAVREMRRVCRRRLILVVPRQRPYRYTFDLHLHFFPYRHSLLLPLAPPKAFTLEEVGGDWVYTEDVETSAGVEAPSALTLPERDELA